MSEGLRQYKYENGEDSERSRIMLETQGGDDEAAIYNTLNKGGEKVEGWDYVAPEGLLDTVIYESHKLDIEKWNGMSFVERHRLLTELFHFIEEDGEYAVKALSSLLAIEDNYLLKVLIESFLRSNFEEYTLEEKKHLIADNWKDISTVDNGETVVTLEIVHFNLNRIVDSPEDLSEQEVEDITAEILNFDRLVINKYLAGRFEQVNDYSMSNKILLQQQFSPNVDIWELRESIRESFLSPISKDFFAVYRGDKVETLVPIASLPSVDSGFDKHTVHRLLDLVVQIRQDVEWCEEEGEDFSDMKEKYLEELNYLNSSLPDSFDKVIRKLNTTIENIQNIRTYISDYDDFTYGAEVFVDDMYRDISRVMVEGLSNGEDIQTFAIDELYGKYDTKRDFDVIDVYKSFSSLHTRATIEKFLGFSYSQIPLRSQLQFIHYVHDKNTAQVERIQDFIKSHGPEGLTTFLSLERGDEVLGEKIVEFGAYKEIAGKVFRYYSELLDIAERAETLVREVSDCEGDMCTELANQVRENILNRAQKDLEKAARSHDPSEVEGQIETYVADAKEYVALLQEVGAGKIESIRSESLSEAEQVRMKELLQTNFDKAYPRPEDEEFKAAVAGSLTNSFSNPNTVFRVLRDKEKIVGFNRFDTLRDHTGKEVSYCGSFNVDPAYNGVGSVMLEETIKERLQDGRPMMAHCDPNQDIAKKYIEHGFVATGLYSFAGKPSFEIWRSQDSVSQLTSKEKSIEELLSETEDTKSILVREKTAPESYPELQDNMGLTRYFTYQGKTYLVFETLPDNLQSDFTPPRDDLKEAA